MLEKEIDIIEDQPTYLLASYKGKLIEIFPIPLDSLTDWEGWSYRFIGEGSSLIPTREELSKIRIKFSTQKVALVSALAKHF